MSTSSGLADIGPLSWGTRVCHLYDDAADLRAALVPFLKAGLDNDERCLLLTAEPLGVAEARALLSQAVPGLSAREAAGDIEIVERPVFRKRHGGDIDAIARGLDEGERQALADGRRGLRLALCSASRLAGRDRQAFALREARLRATCRGRRIVALCSYSPERCRAAGLIEIMRRHDLALTRRGSGWEMVECRSPAGGAVLERRSSRRGPADGDGLSLEVDLGAELAALRARHREIHHRVRNNLQLVRSLLFLKARRLESAAARQVLEEAGGRVLAIGLIHDALYRQGGDTALHLQDYLQALCASLLTAFGAENRVRLEVEGCATSLGIARATTLGMIVTEIVTNALKHAFPEGREGTISVTCTTEEGRCRLSISDDGVGLPPGVLETGRPLSGLDIARALAGQIGGTVGFAPGPSEAGGGTVTVDFPLRLEPPLPNPFLPADK